MIDGPNPEPGPARATMAETNPAGTGEFEEWPEEFRNPAQAPSPASTEPVGAAYVNWLFVDLNSYFASVEQEVRPELRGRPVGVVPMMADTTVCIAASYEAKAFGVKTGTVVADAKKMCPEIVLVEGRHEIYTDYHRRIVEAVESCLPVTAVLSIDEMACRLMGRERPLLAAMELGRKVKARILERVGPMLRSSVGLATNRYLAKVASDMEKPNGLVALPLDILPEALSQLTLRDLPGIGAKTESRLNEKGITTMKQLLALTCEQAGELWGSVWGERLWHWLQGEDFDMSETDHLKSISHSHVLAPEMRTAEKAYAVAHKLLHKAAMRLRANGLWASSGLRGAARGEGAREPIWCADARMARRDQAERVPGQSHFDCGVEPVVGQPSNWRGIRSAVLHRRATERAGSRSAALAESLRQSRWRTEPGAVAEDHGRAEQQVRHEHAGPGDDANRLQSRPHAHCLPQHSRPVLRQGIYAVNHHFSCRTRKGLH
jgi:nucleotidyltransferase/DNA polymerase involved in DNA repair